MADAAPLGVRVYAAYGAGAMGTVTFSVVPGLLLLYFMTDTLGIAPALAGWAPFAGKAWDVATDPLVGSLSDRTRSRWGRRRPWLLAGALTLPPAFVLLFAVPDLATPAARFAWVLGAFVLAATAFTVYQVPYVAMPAEMTTDPHEQTVIMAWRMGFMTLGILVAGALAPLLVETFGGGRAGYAAMALVLAAVVLAALVTALVGTAGVPSAPAAVAPERLRVQLGAALGSRPFRALLAAILVQLVGVSTLLAAVPYFATWVLGGGGRLVTTLFVVLVAPAIAAMPLWVAIGRRVGKVRGYAAAVALYAVAGLGLGVVGPGQPAALYAVVALMGLAYGGTQLFPFALLPDVIQAEHARTGVRREGVMSGLFTCAEKCGNALGALCTAAILAAAGFVEGSPPSQPASALAGIRLAVSLVPAVLLLASLLALRRWEG